MKDGNWNLKNSGSSAVFFVIRRIVPPLLPNFISCSPYVDRFAQIFVSHIDLGFLQYLACFICTNQSLLGIQNQIKLGKNHPANCPVWTCHLWLNLYILDDWAGLRFQQMNCIFRLSHDEIFIRTEFFFSFYVNLQKQLNSSLVRWD